MRKTLFKIHSWVALIALIPLLVISITGSVLVFKSEIDGLLMPDNHFVVQQQANRLPIDTLITKTQKTYPEYVVGSWEIFNDNTADRVYLIKRGTEDWYKFHLDQYTGNILSEPVGTSHYFTDWFLDLHYTFLLNDLKSLPGQTGTVLGFFFAVFFLVLGITGLIIYRKFWQRLFSVRWRATLQIVLSDIHKMTGVIGSPIIIILAITGGYFNGAVWYHEVIEHAEEEHFVLTKDLYNEEISFQHVLDDSQKQIPTFNGTFLVMPLEPDENITLFGEVDTSNPLASEYANTVTYNKLTGEHMANWDIREVGVGWQVIDSFRKLHFGYFAGLISKIIWCVIGLSPVWLGGTGFYLWFTRRKRKKQSQKNRLSKHRTVSA
ncbi:MULTISPECIES: PepSY-associated TM helix domain-containing protein [Pseudoalteromonas]|uniref:PepSY-associated TM helix domain-containing protein n=1 Tax=Pseudoalteromonas TaxID=53246 RepID=UPI00041B6BBE|nr:MULTISPECIES: PepSY-associated TM helix domain-containing protein [unclassified Pseudoalteromonas]MDC9520999.1 PepSY-associated TM helix domain-containing protein [Pseudoalteromonas sp. Angola-31]MDC9497686.1 PepSY-associated TM helix domain-containing protein [Pseudoalteromonas sp. Angola-20]MDC9510546.1 PepSY-associated TM helix domain-containing protein [Pseudoalteromonas sp. Angola-4]MDC9517551.1 PepSY-associated TM helix domain-containing protein [Pseudoalteromonas sp. Angola-22]MDC953|tara:strand:- start:1317 stop:2450 length:1134 start_codon:yes stop_codon:yes gene_type:complete